MLGAAVVGVDEVVVAVTSGVVVLITWTDFMAIEKALERNT